MNDSTPSAQELLRDIDADAARLMASPGFPRAVAAFCDGFTGMQSRMRGTKVGPVDTQLWSIGACILALDARSPRGAHTAEVVRLAGLGGIGGKAAVRNTIATLRSMGLLVVEPLPEDHRQLRLRPTEVMFVVLRAGLTVRLSALHHVRPLPEPPGEWAARRDVQLRYILGNVDAYVQSRFLLMDGFHEVRQMLDRRSGYPVMLELIAHAKDDGEVVRSHVSPTRCAERFNVSRTQVRKLLLAAQARGWLVIEGNSGHVQLVRESHERLRMWIARELAWLWRLVAGSA